MPEARQPYWKCKGRQAPPTSLRVTPFNSEGDTHLLPTHDSALIPPATHQSLMLPTISLSPALLRWTATHSLIPRYQSQTTSRHQADSYWEMIQQPEPSIPLTGISQAPAIYPA